MSNFGDVPEDFRARTAFFEAAANSTLDGILVVDANRKMILQNQRMVELFGIPQEIAEDQDDRKRVKWVTDLVKYPEPFIEKVKYLYSHPDETSRDEIELRDGRFLDRYSSPVIGGDGEYYGRIWAFRDITELKQNETSLKLFRALVDHSSDAIHVVDPDTGRFIDVNERTLRDLGYTVDEMRALTVFDVAVGLDRAAFDAIKSRSKEMGGATGEFPLRRKDGSTFLIEVSLSTVTLERDYLVASVRDITERKEAESQVLLQSAALEAVANGIVITNGNGLIQWTNHSFTHLTGYTTAEVIGRNPNILKSGKQDTAFYAKLWETIRFGKVWKGELVNRRKDGTFYAEEMTITPMRDAAGNIAHYIAVKQDITQRKALEAKLVDVSRQAGMAEIATGVLHNVGNVLNSLNVSVDVLAEQVRSTAVDELDRVIELLRAQGPNLASYFADGPRGPKVIEYLSSLSLMLRGLKDGEFGELSSLRRNTDHIKDIVVTQQNYATTAGLTEKVHVNDLIEDTLAMGAVVLHRDQVRVVREFARDVPPVTTEKYKVLQVLVNLMKNARHACNASQRDDKQIIVRVTHSRENVRLQVIDNGIGISADHLNRIFSHGFTTKNNGHGFGLHNSANAAMEIGGSLSAQSDGPGFGATFTLEIPLRYHAATAAADRN